MRRTHAVVRSWWLWLAFASVDTTEIRFNAEASFVLTTRYMHTAMNEVLGIT